MSLAATNTAVMCSAGIAGDGQHNEAQELRLRPQVLLTCSINSHGYAEAMMTLFVKVLSTKKQEQAQILCSRPWSAPVQQALTDFSQHRMTEVHSSVHNSQQRSPGYTCLSPVKHGAEHLHTSRSCHRTEASTGSSGQDRGWSRTHRHSDASCEIL